MGGVFENKQRGPAAEAGPLGTRFGTILASVLESVFRVISGIVLRPMLVVFRSRFGVKFEPKVWIDAKRMSFKN